MKEIPWDLILRQRFLEFFILLSALMPKGKSVQQTLYVFNNEANYCSLSLWSSKETQLYVGNA